MTNKQWDIFISHASEDKKSIALPLAEELQKKDLKVWYDDFTLTIGDSLRSSIDCGLHNSKYGVVILSPNFFNKKWTKYELNGLEAKITGTEKVILPIFHEVDQKAVASFSPTLADKLAVSTSAGLDTVVQEILKVVRPSALLSNTTQKVHRTTHGHEPINKRIRWQPLLTITVILLVSAGFLAYTVTTNIQWGQEYIKLEQLVGQTKIVIEQAWNSKYDRDTSIIVKKRDLDEVLIERAYWKEQTVLADELVMRDGIRNKRVVKRTYYYPESGDLLAIERVDSKLEESRCAPKCIVTDFYSSRNSIVPFIRKITTDRGIKLKLLVDEDLDGTFNFTQEAYLGLFPYAYLFYVF